jgi:small-conductance mechanosensitive channel
MENWTGISTSLEERLEPAVERIVERSRNILANAPIFLVALAVFVTIVTLGWILTKRLAIWQRLAPNPFIADVYRAVGRILFGLLGLVAALEILNATAQFGAVLRAAGLVGLALGFAVRDTVENFIASILLSLRQPFRPNDFVEIDGVQGSVARLTSRATILISPDGNHIRIPNATVFKGRITNFTRDANRRFTFTLGVDADSNLAAALATAVEALDSLPFVLGAPPVSAWVEEVGDSNVRLTFAGWVDQRNTDFAKACGEATRKAKVALEQAGFGLPEPIYRLRIQDQSGIAVTQPGQNDTPPHRTEPAAAATSRLTEASDPGQTESHVEDAVAREHVASDSGSDLLGDGKTVE